MGCAGTSGRFLLHRQGGGRSAHTGGKAGQTDPRRLRRLAAAATSDRRRIDWAADEISPATSDETFSQYTRGAIAKRMTQDLPPSIDPNAAARWERAVCRESPWLHEEVARRMEERLQWMTLQPDRWIHWEPLRGGLQVHDALLRRYPKSRPFVLVGPVEQAQAAMDLIVKPWWTRQRWVGPQTQFVVPPEPVDMLWANMALHMAADPLALIRRWHQLIRTDGFLMFSCLGPDTLGQLRGVHAKHGWPAPTHDFTDMHDWGDMLVAAGFAEPVMDMERVTLSFSTPQALRAELRQLGRNLSVHRFNGLRSRAWGERWHQAVQDGLPSPHEDGRLTVTFEVVYGHAFKPKPRHSLAPSTSISLDEMRASLRQARG